MIEVTGGGGAAGGSSGNSEAAVRTALEDYMARLPEPLNMVEVLTQRHKEKLLWSASTVLHGQVMLLLRRWQRRSCLNVAAYSSASANR